MAQKLTALTALPTPITTGDLLYIVRGGVSYKALESDLPSGGGSGTVTSVAVSGSDGIEVDSGSPVTTFPATVLAEYEILDGANLTQTQDNQDGLKSYKQTVEIKLAQNQYLVDIENLLKKDVRIIIQDKNGKFRLLGAYNGVECTSIEYATGGGYSDLNGMTISFEATELEEALYLDEIPDGSFNLGNFLLLETGLYLLLETGSLFELE